MKTEKLIVSEVFYSIQGEGATMGIPSIFLRLAGCNLYCEGKGWRCDTIEVWQKGKAMDFNAVLSEEFVIRLREGAHLIITGGEPLLHQQSIVKFIEWFKYNFNFKPFIEIETNGTLLPKEDLYGLVEQWNVSPKLSSSGEAADKRIQEHVLNFFHISPFAIFKFVISDEADIQELLQDYYSFLSAKVYLMPAGSSRDELNKTRELTARSAILMGLKYSDRLHIVIWNKKTGV